MFLRNTFLHKQTSSGKLQLNTKTMNLLILNDEDLNIAKDAICNKIEEEVQNYDTDFDDSVWIYSSDCAIPKGLGSIAFYLSVRYFFPQWNGNPTEQPSSYAQIEIKDLAGQSDVSDDISLNIDEREINRIFLNYEF